MSWEKPDQKISTPMAMRTNAAILVTTVVVASAALMLSLLLASCQGGAADRYVRIS